MGMAFASKTRASVMAFVRNNVINSVAICVLVTIAALLCCIAASQKLVEALKSIMDYLGHLANSDFSTKCRFPFCVGRMRSVLWEVMQQPSVVL